MSESKDIVTFEEVKLASENDEVLIIDVREPSELTQTGKIPNSVNIPLGRIEEVLGSMTPSDFEQSYGRDKPKKDDQLIFSCKSGRRAENAQNIAIKLRYGNTKLYQGSWMDWESNINK